jgi:hypothetical protein
MPPPRSSRARSHPRQPLIGANTERCIYCEGTRITREGKRYKKLETVQLWYCHDCNRVFTPQVVHGKRTPLKVILESLCLYYRGRDAPARLAPDQGAFWPQCKSLSENKAFIREAFRSYA